jgi:hypothetical protein
MIHNIAPTQITLHRSHLSHDALCPICREQEETISHILRCNDTNGVLEQHFCTLLNKKLKVKTEELKTVINDIYESIFDKPTGSVQDINWEMQQLIGWDCCIQGILSTEWLAVSRLMNLKNRTLKSLEGLLLCYGKHGTKPGKLESRNSKKKTDILLKPLTCSV